MNINNPGNVAAVWTNPVRTLTGLGGGITPNVGAVTLTLANGSNAVFTPAPNTVEHLTIIGVGQANVQWTAGLTAGGVFRFGPGVTLGNTLQVTMVSTTGAQAFLNNNGSVSGTYAVARIIFNQ